MNECKGEMGWNLRRSEKPENPEKVRFDDDTICSEHLHYRTLAGKSLVTAEIKLKYYQYASLKERLYRCPKSFNSYDCVVSQLKLRTVKG